MATIFPPLLLYVTSNSCMFSNKKMIFFKVAITILISITFNRALAADPDPLQDVCVADYNSYITVNGYACKRNYTYIPEDFASMALAQPGEPNIFGTRIGRANVDNMPGLNTQGLAFSRIDYELGGLNPPHAHPRSSEILFLIKGTLRAAFITTDNVYVNKLIRTGETFIFPRGLIHFQFNVGKCKAISIVAFNSQKPGVQTLADSMFGSTPEIPDYVLAQAFQISEEEVREIRARLVPRNVTIEYSTRDIM